MNGEFNFLRTVAYPIAYFSCFFAIKALFFTAFNAKIYFDLKNLAKNTFPNDPDPNYLMISKDEIPILKY